MSRQSRKKSRSRRRTPRPYYAERVVISPTVDDAAVTSGRWLLEGLREDGRSVEETARQVAEHLAGVVARYRQGVAS